MSLGPRSENPKSLTPMRQTVGRVSRVRDQALVNAVTKAVIETIGGAGFTVQLYGKDGQSEVQAVFFLTRNLRIGLERVHDELRKARRFLDVIKARQKSETDPA